MSDEDNALNKHSVKAKMSEFDIPPIKDGLVLGKAAPIGSIAMCNALELLHAAPFEHIEMKDHDIISDILVRKGLLRRLPRDKLIRFVENRIVPLMDQSEIIHLELKAEVFISEDRL